MSKLSEYIALQSGAIPEAPNDGEQYARQSLGWSIVVGSGGGIPESPTDGQTYGRRGSNGSWQATLNKVESDAAYQPKGTYLTEAPTGGLSYVRRGSDGSWQAGLTKTESDALYQPKGSYIGEAPNDGQQYARQSEGWSVVVGGGGGIPDAPSDGSAYGRLNANWVTVARSTHSHSYAPDLDYLRADTADTKSSGDLSFSSNVAARWNGNRIYYSSSTMYLDMSTSFGSFLIRSGSTTRFTFARSTGNFSATGNVTAYSDKRLKRDITPIKNALGKVRALMGCTFERIDIDGGRHIGLIAQDVQKVAPEAVIEQDDGYLSLAYGNLVGLLVEAIKELDDKIEAL